MSCIRVEMPLPIQRLALTSPPAYEHRKTTQQRPRQKSKICHLSTKEETDVKHTAEIADLLGIS